MSKSNWENSENFGIFLLFLTLPLMLIVGTGILIFLIFSYICPVFLIKVLARLSDRKQCYTYDEKQEEAIRYMLRLKENEDFWRRMPKPYTFHSLIFYMTYGVLKLRYKNELLYYKLKPETNG